MKLKTEHLIYEHGFVTIVLTGDDDFECGRIHPSGWENCRWPEALGEEPEWFDDEVSVLADQVEMEHLRLRLEDEDFRRQMDADYVRGKEMT